MKYSTRDLFWLCLVVAISAGWLIDRQRQHVLSEQKQQAVTTELEMTKAELETAKVKANDLAINLDWLAAEHKLFKSRADKWLEELIKHGLVTLPTHEPQRHPAD